MPIKQALKLETLFDKLKSKKKQNGKNSVSGFFFTLRFT